MQTQTQIPLVHEVVKVKPGVYVVYSIRNNEYVFAQVIGVRHINSSVTENVYLGYVTKEELCETTPEGMIVRCTPNKMKNVKKAALEFARKLA